MVCWGSNEFGQSSGGLSRDVSMPPVMINLESGQWSHFPQGCSFATMGGDLVLGGFILPSIFDEIFFYQDPQKFLLQFKKICSISSGPNHVCASTMEEIHIVGVLIRTD